MREHLSSLGRQTLVYGLSATAIQIVGVITLPVFARVFTPAEYGALEIATVGLAAMALIADLGMASAAQRSYFDYGDEQSAERRRVLATAVATALTASLTLCVLVVVFRRPLADWLFDEQLYTTLVVLVGVAIPLTILAALLREVMRLHFRPWHYAVSSTLAAGVTGGISVVLVLATDVGIEGVLIGAVAGSAIAAAYGLVVEGRELRAPLSRGELRTMLAYGLPIVPTAAALWGLTFLDRIMLSRLGNLAEVGQYALAARFSMVVTLVVTAFGLAFSPFILSLWSEDREAEKRVRARTLTYLTVVLTSLSLVFALFAREVISVIAPNFDGAHEQVGILCLGITLFGISTVTMTGITFMRRTRLFALYSGLAVLINVALCFVLIPPLGGVGASLATASGYGILAIGYYLHGQRLYPTEYQPRKVVAVLLVAAAIIPLGLLPLGLPAAGLKLAGLAIFAVALAAMQIFDPPEIAELRELVRRMTGRRADGAAAEATGRT